MPSFVAQSGYYPRPGDRVIGRHGHKEETGWVLPARSNPRKPRVFSRHGFVAVYIATDSGRQVAVNEVRLAGGAK